MKEFEIEEKEISRIMKQVFGTKPNIANIKKFFSNELI